MKSTSSYKKVKENCFTKDKQLRAFIPLLFIFMITPSHANTINTQRQDYLEAKKAFELKQYKKFGRIAKTNKIKNWKKRTNIGYDSRWQRAKSIFIFKPNIGFFNFRNILKN